MAMSTTTSASSRKSYIDAAQTVMPAKVTNPRKTRRVTVPDPHCSGTLRQRTHIVLCYHKVTEDDCGRLVAGWVKESLSKALAEQSMFGGRLRHEPEGDGELELVSNDSGIRLVEAVIKMTMTEFLGLSEKKDVEAQLVFWKDIDAQDPVFSPLFYVQVTNFECGGYSIGISCSVLLADPLVLTSFLNRWTHIHKRILSQTEMPKIPMFYLPNYKRVNPSISLSSSPNNSTCKTMLFKVAASSMNMITEDVHKRLLSTCVEEAEQENGHYRVAQYSLVKKEPSGDIKVEHCQKEAVILQTPASSKKEVESTSWDGLGASKVAFREGNNPVHVSYWIESTPNGGLVLVMHSGGIEGILGTTISVTIPVAVSNGDEEQSKSL